MLINLSAEEIRKVAHIEETRKKNFTILSIYSDYINNRPDAINKEMITELTCNYGITEEYAFYAIFCAACGLDIENKKNDSLFAKEYLIPSIKKLEIKDYTDNPYYKNIEIPNVKCGDWELKHEIIKPYEAFIYQDITVTNDYKEIPMLGFFSEEFRFPAVLQNGNEWMTLMPNETATSSESIAAAIGNVLTYGLGLGYFVYMTSQKANVTSITVVERDNNVIKLFEQYILPQFPQRQKVKIINMDAFEFAEKHFDENQFDYVFTDIWHDASDGLDLYLKMKKHEKSNSNTVYSYWIEETLLSHLRWMVFNSYWTNINAEQFGNLSDEKTINSYSEIVESLKSDSLRTLAKDINILAVE